MLPHYPVVGGFERSEMESTTNAANIPRWLAMPTPRQAHAAPSEEANEVGTKNSNADKVMNNHDVTTKNFWAVVIGPV